MEFSDVPAHHRHHQSRHGKHQSRRSKHRVARTARALDSDQRTSPTRWPRREEHALEGNKQSLVDTWLEDIETPRLQRAHKNESLSKEHGPKARSRHGSTYRLRSPSPRREFSRNSHNGPPSEVSPRKRWRERNRLRDLGQENAVPDLCDEQETVRVQPKLPRIARPVSAARESNHDNEKKRPRMGSEDSEVSVVSAGQYHFEKKARHKTRTDRYDTTRAHEPRKAGKKKRKNTGDQSKSHRTRRGGDFSSAREVMGNFNSKSILSDRITMQPAVRPGLFDNGRASKNQLPDLTFHEMHFLKQPPPSKPVTRGRERAKRRGERELEEVSAFFLHKGLPEASGVPGRDQLASGASSPGRATRDSSASRIEVPPHQLRSDEEYGHNSPHVDRESSRGATNWTWSSSCVPLERGISQASVVRGPAPAQSSSTSRSRNALERTEIFRNTGISCVQHPREVSRATPRTKDNSGNREPLAVMSADIVNRQSDTSRQRFRVVRYHDRGVMANEEAENTAVRRQKSTEFGQDAVEQPTRETPVKITASANSASHSHFAAEDKTVSHPQVEGNVFPATAFRAADHDPGPDRPRSPKCTVVEQLEAAAEDVESQELRNDLDRRLTSLPIQEDVHSASDHHNNLIPDSHDAFQRGRLGFKPGFVDYRLMDLLETDQENTRLHSIADARQDNQRAREATLNPQIALKPTVGNSHQVSNIEQPAFDVQIMSGACRGSSAAHSMPHYTLENPSNAQVIPLNSDTASHTVMSDWPAASHGQLQSNHFFPRAQPVLQEGVGLSPQRPSRQQSLEEYIAQMENDVLCRPQEDDNDGDSPMPNWHELQDNNAVYLLPYFGAYDQDLSEDGHLKNQSIDQTHHGGGGVTPSSDVDQEEQRFMSTFWRPNRY